jgi:cellulose synthase/poly-beta-1,6-N-acetylglucosamine synthase-like glycosyltransferase
VLFFFGVPIFVFVLYGITVLYYGKLRNKQKETRGDGGKDDFEPFVSVIVPTHNEQMIISKKIETLLNSEYSQDKIEFIFVDDSNDMTPEIIEDYQKKFSSVRLIRFHERMGYSPSMIAGCKAAKGEILVLSDAGSFLDSEAIADLVAHFQNPNIGVVTGKGVIMNVDEKIGKSESQYQKILNFLRRAENNMDSTFMVKGEATAVRKDLLKDLEECTETFDTTVGLFARQKGYRTVYDSNIKFYEYAPLTQSGWIKQKTIRAANLIKVLFKFKHMLFNPRYGKFGLLILPMNFAMLVVVPLAILIGFSLLGVLTLFDLSFSLVVWGILSSIFICAAVFSRRLVLTFLEFEWSLLRALYEVAFTKRTHDKIEKVVSTRR